jgi:hypothetical protein
MLVFWHFTCSLHNHLCCLSSIVCATADTMSFGMVATNTQNPAFEHLANIYGLQGRKLPIFIVQKEGKTAPIVREWTGMRLSLICHARIIVSINEKCQICKQSNTCVHPLHFSSRNLMTFSSRTLMTQIKLEFNHNFRMHCLLSC